MISIIVSSYNKDYFDNFSSNVAETIGVPYEIVQIWNPGTMGICEAYNQGAARAKYAYLIFCHEDICFKTMDWGKIFMQFFTDKPLLGALGFAGSSYIPYMFTGWDAYLGAHLKMFIEQGYKNKHRKSIKVSYGSDNKLFQPVLGLDGCCIATTRSVYENCRFDSDTFKGFHFYDVDFTLQVSRKFEVAVIYNIELLHFSEGGYDKTWVEEFRKFNQKWQSLLPLTGNAIKPDVNIESGAMDKFLMMCLQLGYPLSYYRKCLFSAHFIKLSGVRNWCQYLIGLPVKYIKFVRYIKTLTNDQ